MSTSWRAPLPAAGGGILILALLTAVLFAAGAPTPPAEDREMRPGEAPSLAVRARPPQTEARSPGPESGSACDEALAVASGEPDASGAAELLRIVGDKEVECFHRLPLAWQLALLLAACEEDKLPEACFRAWYSNVRSESTLIRSMNRPALFRMLTCSSRSLVDATSRDGAACASFLLAAWGDEPMPPTSREMASICRSLVGSIAPDDARFWKAFWEACGEGATAATVRALVLQAVEGAFPDRGRVFLCATLAWEDPSAARTAALASITLRGSSLARSLLNDFTLLQDDRLALIAVNAIPLRERWPSSDVPPIADPSHVEHLLLLEQPRLAAEDDQSNTALRATLLGSEWEFLGPDRAAAALYSSMAAGIPEANPETARLRVAAALRYIVAMSPPASSLAAIELAKRAIREGIEASPVSRVSVLIRAVASDMDADDCWPRVRVALREAIGVRSSELPQDVRALIY